MADTISEARIKLKVPQDFYEWCHDLEHCPDIGWHEPANGKSKSDTISDLIKSTYRLLKANNYDYRTLALYIWPSTKFRPSFSEEDYGLSEIRFISFAQENRTPFCLPVQLLRGDNDKIDIRLKLGGSWITFCAFLDTLVLAAPVDHAKSTYLWKRSGQSFRILDLPRELRDQIWFYAVFEKKPAIAHPFCYSRRGAKIEGVRCYQGTFHNVALMDPKMHQQVRDESKEVLYTKATFQFRSTHAFSVFYFGLRPQIWNLLRKLELEFGYEDWLCILGAHLSTSVRFNPCRSLEGLKVLKLKELKIIFRAPLDLEVGKSMLFHDNNGCHTKVVQWILDLLIPVLVHIDVKELRIEGFIKNVQKARFFDQLDNFKYSLEVVDVKPDDLVDEDESGGVSLDDPRAKAIMAMPDCVEEPEKPDDIYDSEEIYPDTELPPSCLCKHKCTLDAEELLKNIDDDDMSVLGL